MKIRYLAIISFFIYFISCSESNKKFVNEYKNETMQMSISYPENWEIDSASYTIKEDIQEGGDVFQESIIFRFEKLPIKVNMHDYMQSIIATYKILDSTYTQISLDTFKHDYYNAYKLRYTSSNGFKYNNTTYVLAKDLITYIVQCNAVDSSVDSHAKIFDEIVSNIQPIL